MSLLRSFIVVGRLPRLRRIASIRRTGGGDRGAVHLLDVGRPVVARRVERERVHVVPGPARWSARGCCRRRSAARTGRTRCRGRGSGAGSPAGSGSGRGRVASLAGPVGARRAASGPARRALCARSEVDSSRSTEAAPGNCHSGSRARPAEPPSSGCSVKYVADVAVDAAEGQRVPGAGADVVELRLADRRLGRADGEDRVHHVVAGHDVDHRVRRRPGTRAARRARTPGSAARPS